MVTSEQGWVKCVCSNKKCLWVIIFLSQNIFPTPPNHCIKIEKLGWCSEPQPLSPNPRRGKPGMMPVSLRQAGVILEDSGSRGQERYEASFALQGQGESRGWIPLHDTLGSFPVFFVTFPPPPPPGTNAPSANVTVAFHEAYVGVVVMNQLNCHAILGSFRGKIKKENLWRKPRAGQRPLSLLQSYPPS